MASRKLEGEPPVKACVTGATGFVGAHVAAALAAEADGAPVRVTVRDPARLEALRGVEVEPVGADVLDRRSMRKALDGCDVLFHTAGLVAAAPGAMSGESTRWPPGSPSRRRRRSGCGASC